MQALLTVDQLALYLHKTAGSIRSDASRNPESLPPICRLPHTKRLLWRVEDVERWLAHHVQEDAKPQSTAVTIRRRGRPTKAQQRARASRWAWIITPHLWQR